MALAWAVQGATKRGQSITWASESGSVVDLTGADITGTIETPYGVVRSITGTMVADTPATGVFVWTYSLADVATEGKHVVQFSATYGDTRVERTLPVDWVVERAVL